MIEQLEIKDAMKRKGAPVNEVAEEMGISRMLLGAYVNGRPSADNLLRIDCDVTELFERLQTKAVTLNYGGFITIKAERA